MSDFWSMERYLQQFELEEYGTTDWGEIQAVLQERTWKAAQDRMTGMEDEQAEWESS